MAKTKGTTVVGAVKFLRRHAKDARRLLPERLHGYLEERVSIASWYPEADLLELVRAVAALAPLPEARVYEGMGRATAREHLEGIYSHLMAEGDRLSLPRRAFALWSSQHDTGRLSLTSTGPRSARMEVADFGLPSPEMCEIVRGYFLESLEASGLAAPEAVKVACRCRGDEVCAWEFRWAEG